MRAHRIGVMATLLAVAGMSGTAAPAAAVPVELHESELFLFLSAAEPEEDDQTAMSWMRFVSLDCHPTGGSHPDPEAACALLEEAEGDPGAIPAQNGACTMDYAPVRAAMHGHWMGGSVEFEHTYANLCHAVDDTAGLFDF
jgi:hypothetical protein